MGCIYKGEKRKLSKLCMEMEGWAQLQGLGRELNKQTGMGTRQDLINHEPKGMNFSFILFF